MYEPPPLAVFEFPLLREQHSPRVSSALFFRYNTALVPPYHVLVDTNFLSFTVQNKLDLLSAMMDCLYAKCIPIITDWCAPTRRAWKNC